jgi:hypothetical protein
MGEGQMSEMNMTAVVLGFALVIALFTKLHQQITLPAWLSPLRLNRIVGLLGKLQPWVQKGEGLAIALGYLVVVLLLCNTSLLVLLLVLHGLNKWLSAAPSGRYTEQMA